eukprot:scaffold19002_cov18-Prasinocladus_malaysianus.AAC.1
MADGGVLIIEPAAMPATKADRCALFLQSMSLFCAELGKHNNIEDFLPTACHNVQLIDIVAVATFTMYVTEGVGP